MTAKRIIRLSLQPPFRFYEAQYPLIATAEHRLVDNTEHAYEATRRTLWFIGVRRRADGSEVVIYAKYRHTTRWQDEQGHWAEYGELLRNPTAEEVRQGVLDVAGDIAAAEHKGVDHKLWPILARECSVGVTNFYC